MLKYIEKKKSHIFFAVHLTKRLSISPFFEFRLGGMTSICQCNISKHDFWKLVCIGACLLFMLGTLQEKMKKIQLVSWLRKHIKTPAILATPKVPAEVPYI